MKGLLQTVKKFCGDTGMKFNLNKCAKTTFKRGKIQTPFNIFLKQDPTIMGLEQERSYKYTGTNKSDAIQHASVKEKKKKYYHRRG